MKFVTLAFAVLTGFSVHADPAAQFVETTLADAQHILGQPEPDRTALLCELLHIGLDKQSIAQVWLGNYWSLPREQQSVTNFVELVPSVMMSKVAPLLGSGGVNGGITVDPASKDRGNGLREVTVTVTNNGNVYTGHAVVRENVGLRGHQLLDIEYMGFSAVDYQGREYLRYLDREYNKDINTSMPVTSLIELITTSEDYVACP